jgi:two-component system response regulator RegA
MREMVDSGRAKQASAASVLLIDESELSLRALARGLVDLGSNVWTARTFEAAHFILRTCAPSYVVSELRIEGRWLAEFVADVAAKVPIDRFVVATAYPSVATAVRFTRLGVAAYFAKPVSPQALLDGLATQAKPGPGASAAPEPFVWPTLDRTIWEYLSEVHASAGSISEAARRLGLDRRSLRRMLAKRPPPR